MVSKQIKGIISQSIENRRGSGSAQQSSTSLSESPASSSRFFKPRHRSGQDVLDKDGEGESFQKFCRGSIKRLRCAGEKVTTAKNDMEEIISSAKSVTDVSLEAKLPLNSPRFDPSRLAEDHALAVEAQDEMKNIITKFVDMLKEEEQQLEVQAELLQRRSSQVNLFPCVQKPPRYDFGDDIDENDDLESPQLSAEGTKVFGAVQE